MIETDYLKGVEARVRNTNFTKFGVAFLALAAIILSGCGGSTTSNSNSSTTGVDPNETAATVNGKTIKLEDVERLIKQQGQGQEAKLSPLELAQARLSVLQNLIQEEVLFQKAEKENTVPTDDEVKTEYNKLKTSSGKSEEEFLKGLQAANETEDSLREKLKKQLAVKKLEEKISSRVENPKDSEIDAFYNGNKSAFVKKKGVKLAAIVIDPTDGGEGDTTKNDADAVRVGNEIVKQLQQNPESFAQVAREKSEDQSRLQGGDLGYIAEEELKQSFSPQTAAVLMNPQFGIGQITVAQSQGKYFVLKLQERSDKDEDVTLETPGVRQQVTDSLTNARKQLLVQAFASIAMNEAKIVNYLAQKVVDNPNELSGARPAGADVPKNTNANTNAAANTNTNTNANTKAGNTKAANTNVKVEEKTSANTTKTNTNTAANK